MSVYIQGGLMAICLDISKAQDRNSSEEKISMQIM